MKIALLGYGKMGKAIEKFAQSKGHSIELIIDSKEDWDNNITKLSQIDVAIDFSTPNNIIENIHHCFKNNIPIVVGTTGWYQYAEELKQTCQSQNQSLIWASNFSIGVNLFFKLNRELAKLMNSYENYDVSMKEIHHTAKLDAPSGTAISLANAIIDEVERKSVWELGNIKSENKLMIDAQRIDPVPGTHEIKYESDIDQIQIIHTAKNRNGFALGSILAAEWVINHKGWYEFKDVFF